MILWDGSFHKLLDYFHQKSIYLQNMRYKYLTIALMSGVLFAQGKISLESVLDLSLIHISEPTRPERISFSRVWV